MLPSSSICTVVRDQSLHLVSIFDMPMEIEVEKQKSLGFDNFFGK